MSLPAVKTICTASGRRRPRRKSIRRKPTFRQDKGRNEAAGSIVDRGPWLRPVVAGFLPWKPGGAECQGVAGGAHRAPVVADVLDHPGRLCGGGGLAGRGGFSLAPFRDVGG